MHCQCRKHMGYTESSVQSRRMHSRVYIMPLNQMRLKQIKLILAQRSATDACPEQPRLTL
jgi:hypothetical protein